MSGILDPRRIAGILRGAAFCVGPTELAGGFSSRRGLFWPNRPPRACQRPAVWAGRVGVGRPAWSSQAGRPARPKFGAQRSGIAVLGDSTRADNDREAVAPAAKAVRR